jgi:hypothetical protein
VRNVTQNGPVITYLGLLNFADNVNYYSIRKTNVKSMCSYSSSLDAAAATGRLDDATGRRGTCS